MSALILVNTLTLVNLSVVISLIILLCWAKLIKISNNLILTLLTLELIILTNYLIITSAVYLENISSGLFLTYFTFAVAEASLGLGILIFLVRNKGNEFLSSDWPLKLNKLLSFKVKIVNQ